MIPAIVPRSRCRTAVALPGRTFLLGLFGFGIESEELLDVEVKTAEAFDLVAYLLVQSTSLVSIAAHAGVDQDGLGVDSDWLDQWVLGPLTNARLTHLSENSECHIACKCAETFHEAPEISVVAIAPLACLRLSG